MFIILHNILDNMMFQLQDCILQIAGVWEIRASPRNHDLDWCSILVDKTYSNRFFAMHHWWRSWKNGLLRNDIPSDVQSQQDHFLLGTETSVKPPFDYGFSSGENSCLIQNHASFISMNLLQALQCYLSILFCWRSGYSQTTLTYQPQVLSHQQKGTCKQQH